MVSGNAFNAGQLEVYGMIIGQLNSATSARTTLVRGSQFSGNVTA